MPDVDICVDDPVHIDEAVYKLWLRGDSVAEAARLQCSLQERKPVVPLQHASALSSIDELHVSLIHGETNDQYLTYSMLETWLMSAPPTLDVQTIIPMPPTLQHRLIDLYYSFDDNHLAVRELLGKKLTGRLRSNLDDISDKTGVPLKSCRRQFDNIRRVFRCVEDKPGSLVVNIQRMFLLSPELASKYATVVFMALYKFETGKKRLNYLAFHDFHACAEQMIDKWTSGSEGENDAAANVDTDIDRLFLQDLKEVRGIIESDADAQRNFACHFLLARLADHHHGNLEQRFKQLNKSLLKISEGLVHKTELKDFFSDLEEKFMDPCRQWDLTADEINLFMAAMIEASKHVDQLSKRKRKYLAYTKFLKTVQHCVQKFASAPK